MVNVTKGVLLKCSDAAIKQFVKYLDETNALGRKFVLHDLDEVHLFVSGDMSRELQRKLDDLMARNSYTEYGGDAAGAAGPRVRKE